MAGGVAVCLVAVYPLFDAYLRTSQFRRTLGFIHLVSPEVTIWSARAIAGGFVAVALVLSRTFIDPRVVSIDSNGIEIRHFLSVHRGQWRDFVSMRAVGRRGMGTVRLMFKTASGSHAKVNLPPKFLGVDLRAVVADIAVYIMEPKKAPEGSLDKYDPKKLARQAAAALAAEEAAVPGVATARRTFGKRNATAA